MHLREDATKVAIKEPSGQLGGGKVDEGAEIAGGEGGAEIEGDQRLLGAEGNRLVEGKAVGGGGLDAIGHGWRTQ